MFVRALRLFNPIGVRRYNFCTAKNPQIYEEVKAKVYKVLSSAAKCKTQNLKDDAKFEDLGFDSLDAVEMVVALEENFGYDIQNEEAERIRGVGDAIAIFYKYESEKQQTAIKQ